ncbi:hypothetical protein CPB84DRAFT_1689587 [Gymnopilus junonius]|uniref:Uncharacterized protein n=1 Tax=Gymnopilus junonius TaxID=109634 RepID=A0A9P5TFR6_GYMJU|nr:hypothetical protein CPB84DRAFT_1689587 [Gymnopilus junonius]
MQQSILSCIAESVGLKLPFRFLITSRDQPNIRQAFDSDRFRGITLRIHLGSSSNIYLPQPSLQFSATGKPFAIDKSKPRRRALKRPFQFPSYPRIVTLGQRNGHDESYCRSLLSAGHGFPMWKPSGNLAMPVEFLRRGVSIGDVGIIDTYGFFKFYFNIFLPPDDPINANLVPREFCPIEPLLQPDEVVHEEEYFKPGHIIVSKGVTMEKHSKCPLDISFDSTELDGAILILPNGASREDLVSTERFHEYARKNAPHWYQYINHYGHTFHANGSLFLVTGCDKANDWALASFPYHAKRAGEPLRLQYTWQPQYDTPWFDPGTCCTDYYVPTKKLADHPEVKNQCVFLRGMRISLTQSSWQKTLPFDDDAKRHYTFILHTPSKFQLWLNSIFVSLRLRLSEKRAVNIITHRDQVSFLCWNVV